MHPPNRTEIITKTATNPLHSAGDINRRAFLGATVIGILATDLALAGDATAQPNIASTVGNGPFNSLKQVRAGDLSIGYADLGPRHGRPVILLHGWPYDIHTFAGVAPILAQAGYRVIVPHLRGYGSTRFVSADAPRNGQQAAFAADVIALMDALHIPSAVIGGCDWGARTACIVAALWPERCTALNGAFLASAAKQPVLVPRRR